MSKALAKRSPLDMARSSGSICTKELANRALCHVSREALFQRFACALTWLCSGLRRAPKAMPYKSTLRHESKHEKAASGIAQVALQRVLTESLDVSLDDLHVQ